MIADLTYDEDVNLYEEIEDYFDDEDYDYDEDYDDDDEDFDDDEAAEFIGAVLPGPLKFLDPVGAALGAATGRKRRGRGRRRRIRPATGRALYRRPPPRKYVTHKQLRASLARVSRNIRKNGAAIKSVSRQASSNRSRLNQQNSINVRQGRALRALRKDMDQQSQTQLLTSILNRNEEVEVVASDNAEVPVGTTLTLERELDPITFLLPALMGSSSGSGSAGLNNPLLLFALMGR